MPEFYFCWQIPLREWCISIRKLRGGRHRLTGVWLRSGWSVAFGPFSMFWETAHTGPEWYDP